MNAFDPTTMDKRLNGTRRLGRFTLGLWILNLVVLALFVNKVRQTSDWAIQYSRQTQADMGEWSMWMMVIFVLALIFTFLWLGARKRLRLQLDGYLTGVRAELAAARKRGDASAQVEAESELRRLEPYHGTPGSSVHHVGTSRPPAPQPPVEDRYDRLVKLKKLLDDGVLSPTEFDHERARVLGEP